MPAASTILIADSVPVSRTYSPMSTSMASSLFSDLVTAASPAGQSTFVLGLKPATNTTARRAKISFALPREVVVGTAVTVSDVFRFNGEWVIPPAASALERADFEALVRNLVNHAVTQGYVKDGNPVW